MKKVAVIILCVLMLVTGVTSAFASVKPTTWAAVDGLGRTLSSAEDTGARREGKFVGIFYWIWHYTWANFYEPLNTTEVLSRYPEAVNDFSHFAWNDTEHGRPYFWDEPLLGYYSTLDEFVLRKHAELLADADIDVIVFDTTNGALTFAEGYETLFRVWAKAKADGVNVPQISFMLNFAGEEDTRTEILQLYDDVYSKGRYKDLWFMWNGKPLLMGSGESLDLSVEKDRQAYNFFTFRYTSPTYFDEDTAREDNTWGWCSSYPQARYGRNILGDKVEQVCVSVAQNANEYGLCAMNDPTGTVQGRAFAKGNYSYSYTYKNKKVTVNKKTDDLILYGLNFQQQWDNALRIDPEFVFVTGFNEWVAGRHSEWRDTENAFPDQFSPAYSRDIEPSAGVLKDHYYYQLVENVRRFKGCDTKQANTKKTVDINADISQWDNVYPEYTHYVSDGKDRSHAGWVGTYYTDTAARNDIVSSKAAYDDNYIYIMAQTSSPLTDPSDDAWMRLYIDTDLSGISDNWEGFEYVINRTSPQNGVASIERSTGGWNFEKVGDALITVDGNMLQLKISRSDLGLGGIENLKFNFKWSDGCSEDGNILDFYKNGEAAPGGRFAYVFNSEEVTPAERKGRSLFDNIRLILDSIRYIFKLLFAWAPVC